jgi:predicted alpha/beta-fold hydrolase
LTGDCSAIQGSFRPTEFKPRRWLRNPHAQTIAGNYMRRKGPPLPAPGELIVPVEPAHTARLRDGRAVSVPQTGVLCLCHWQPEPSSRLTVVLVHGLEGSAGSGYILGNAARLLAEGCSVVRMNMRACGGADALAPTIYHSGRSEDISAVVQALSARGCTRIALVGYSMGGNLVFRHAGEQSLHGGKSPVVAVAGVSPLLDLAPSSAALHLPSNRMYEKRFLRAMKRRLRAKAALFPAIYGALEGEGVFDRIQTMRDFDGEIVARFGGFRDADDYYEQARASHYAAALAVPALILHAADDPFIRTLPATAAALRANPCVRYIETAHGGHCAFLSEPQNVDQDGDRNGDQGRWAEEMIAQWLVHAIGIETETPALFNEPAP